jgi:hypothetical protein
MTTTPRRRWLRLSLQTAILIASAFAVVGVWDSYRERSRLEAETFHGELWRDPKGIDEGVRLSMADGLIARDELRGLTRSEVVKMLGEPPPPEYFREWDMVYRLGMEGSYFGIDSEWLVIRLGPDGRVIDYRLE